MKANYVVIPLVTLAVAYVGGYFTSIGLADWYRALRLPSWAPGGAVIGAVWTTLYILATISALIVWNTFPRTTTFWFIVSLFVINAFLNAFWNYVFFAKHLIGLAVWEAAILDLTVIGLIAFIWPLSSLASLLLLPYALWVAFATYLTYTIWALNM